MAGTVQVVQAEFTVSPVSEVEANRISVNNLVDDVEKVRRVLAAAHVAVGTVTTAETDLATFSVPANKLSAAFSALRLKVWGSTVNNANAKTLKMYWAGVAVHTVSLTASIAGRWVAEFQIIKTGASTQDWVSEVYEQVAALGAGKGAEDVGTGTGTDTGAIVIKATGTATTTNDIVAEGFVLEYLPVAADLLAAKVNLR